MSFESDLRVNSEEYAAFSIAADPPPFHVFLRKKKKEGTYGRCAEMIRRVLERRTRLGQEEVNEALHGISDIHVFSIIDSLIDLPKQMTHVKRP